MRESKLHVGDTVIINSLDDGGSEVLGILRKKIENPVEGEEIWQVKISKWDYFYPISRLTLKYTSYSQKQTFHQ